MNEETRTSIQLVFGRSWTCRQRLGTLTTSFFPNVGGPLVPRMIYVSYCKLWSFVGYFWAGCIICSSQLLFLPHLFLLFTPTSPFNSAFKLQRDTFQGYRFNCIVQLLINLQCCQVYRMYFLLLPMVYKALPISIATFGTFFHSPKSSSHSSTEVRLVHLLKTLSCLWTLLIPFYCLIDC